MINTSNIIRCTGCNGTKILKGLGSLETKCHYCSGIGWINKKENDQDKISIEEKPKTTIVYKKRGRKPKQMRMGE